MAQNFLSDIKLGDNIYIRLGDATNGDLHLHHNGNNSYIQNDVGHFYIKNRADDGDIVFQSDDGSGGVATYYTVDGGVGQNVFSKDIVVGDNIYLRIGNATNGDLQIFHNGSNSHVQNATGDLYVENLADDKDVIFRSDDGSGGFTEYFRLDGGIVRTVFSKDTKHQDDVKAYFGDSYDLEIYHNGTHSYIDDTGTGKLILRGNTDVEIHKYSGEYMITATADGAVKLYYDDDKKLETTSAGIEITGNLDTPNISINDYVKHNGNADAFFGFPATNTFSVGTGGTERMRVDNTGEVKIGKSIHLGSDSGVLTPAQYSMLIEAPSGSETDINMYTHGSSVFNINSNGTAAKIGWGSSQTRQVNLVNTGSGDIQVGIGTTSPNFKLDIVSAAASTATYQQFRNGTTGTASSDGTVMGIDADGDFLINNQEAKEIKFYTSDTQRLTIASDGAATFAGNVSVNGAGQKAVLHVKNEGNNWEDGILLEHDTGNTGWNIHPEQTNDALWFGYNSDTSVALTSQAATTALKLNSDLSAIFAGTITTDRLSLFTSNTDRATVQAGSSGTTGHLYFNSYTGTTLKQLTWSAANSGFYPQGASGSFDLGLNGNRWNRVYANYFYGDGSNLTGVSAEWDGTLTGNATITSDGSNADGAQLNLKHANNNTTDTIGTIFFGNNADATLSKIVSETSGANNTSNLLFGTSNAGTMSTALTLSADNSATFTGNIRLPSSGKLYTWTGHNDNYLRYDLWRASASAGMTIHNISADGEIYLKSGNALALTLDSSQDAAFTGNVTVYTGDSTGALSVGRNSSERLEIHQGDTNTTVTAYNDIDENQEHNFILDRSFGGSGGNNFLVRKGGVAQLSIDKDGDATFVKDITTNENILVGGDANHNGILTIRSKDSSSVTRQSALKFNIAGTDTVGLTLHNNTSGIATNTLIFDWAGSDKIFFYGNGHITTVDNVTAKIFRDYDNTAYYLDASNTGTSLNVAGDVAAAKGAFTNAIGTLPLTTSTPYDYVAKFESTDAGAYVIIEDNNSTNNANRIGVAGDEMYLQTDGSTRITIGSNGYVGMGIAQTNNQRLTLAEADANGSHIKMNNSRSGGGYWVVGVGDSGSSSSIVDPGGLFFYNGTTKLKLAANGNATIAGNITVDGDQISILAEGTTNKYLYVANDTDYGRAGIGRAALGKLGWDDHAGFAHVDHNGQGGYALLQANDGTTYINTPTGKTAYFRVNNATIGSYSASGLKFTKFFDQSDTNYYLDLNATGTSLNVAGAIQLPDAKGIMWAGNNILSHNGTQTYIGDNSSASAVTITGTNMTVEGDITASGGDVNVTKQNDAPTFVLTHDGTNPGTNDHLWQIASWVDYNGTHQNWGNITHRTTGSATRTELRFDVKSASGNVQNALVLQGQASAVPNAIFAGDVEVGGDLSVTGTTTTVNQTNLDISDNIIGLNRGASSNSNDSGLIIERGSTGDNAAMIWDEANDRFVFGLTTSTPSATGSVSISATSNLAARNLDVNTITGAATTLTSTTSPILILNPTANNYGGVQFNYGGATKGLAMYNSGFMVFGGESGTDTRLQAGGQYAMHIDEANRNVHIGGTSDTSYKLAVNGTLYAAGNTTLAGTLTVQGNANAISLTCADGNSFMNINQTGHENWQFKAVSTSGSMDAVTIGASGGGVVKIYEDGNFQHQGLYPSSGTDIDQIKEFSMTFQLAANTWTDTGIDGTDLATGTYAMQVYVHDYGVAGQHYNEFYSGMISWYADATNSSMVDEIPVHRAGHAPNSGDVQFRTQRASNSDTHDLMLQVKHNLAYNAALDNGGSKIMRFKFRRLI